MRLLFFGTYDTHRPRFRVLRQGLSLSGDTVLECHRSVWGDLEDRSHIRSVWGYLVPCARWCAALPRLFRAYHMLPDHDAVIVPYLGQADAVVARRLARSRGVPLVFDPYVSLHETVIGDRRLAGARSPAARFVRLLDLLAFKAADAVLVDTSSHGELMSEQLGLRLPGRHVVPVGAESDLFEYKELPPQQSPRRVLFYGSMIPLHGIETIVTAAGQLKRDGDIRFTVVGTGQDHAKARALARHHGADEIITWVDHVPYHALPAAIGAADLCLGIFGISRKAQAVVPNKVYQALAVGRPVISADSPAMREWFSHGTNCVLVPPGDPRALAGAIRRVLDDRHFQERLAHEGHQLFRRAFCPSAIGHTAHAALTSIAAARQDTFHAIR